MTADQRYADTLLSYWAKWVRTAIENGYSSETIEYRLMKAGTLISTNYKVEEEDNIAESVEQIVTKMPEQMKKLIKIEYLTYNTRKIKQKRLQMTRWKYEQILRNAQDRVCQEIDLKKNQHRTTLISVW